MRNGAGAVPDGGVDVCVYVASMTDVLLASASVCVGERAGGQKFCMLRPPLLQALQTWEDTANALKKRSLLEFLF